METNGAGGRFPWPMRWLEQAQWPVLWQRAIQGEADLAFDPAAILDLHSVTLWRKLPERAADVETVLAESADMAELARVAEDLARLIQPAAPSPQFREQLKATLLAAHCQHTTQRTLFQQVGDPSLWSWQMIATVPVLIGIAALLWRHTHRSTEQPAEAT